MACAVGAGEYIRKVKTNGICTEQASRSGRAWDLTGLHRSCRHGWIADKMDQTDR